MYRDRCPGCVTTIAAPILIRRVANGVRAVYRCNCGHEWFTSWKETP